MDEIKDFSPPDVACALNMSPGTVENWFRHGYFEPRIVTQGKRNVRRRFTLECVVDIALFDYLVRHGLKLYVAGQIVKRFREEAPAALRVSIPLGLHAAPHDVHIMIDVQAFRERALRRLQAAGLY